MPRSIFIRLDHRPRTQERSRCETEHHTAVPWFITRGGGGTAPVGLYDVHATWTYYVSPAGLQASFTSYLERNRLARHLPEKSQRDSLGPSYQPPLPPRSLAAIPFTRSSPNPYSLPP